MGFIKSSKGWAALGLAGAAIVGREMLRSWREADLEGQTVLITGGSRGLGYLLAREFLSEGCHVAICARDAEELARARRDLQFEGGDVLTVICDVTDRDQVEAMIEEVSHAFGGIDILVNNAGTIQGGPVHSLTEQDFRAALDVILWGMLHPIWAALPQMRRRGAGRIVNITSVGGKVSIPHLLAYSTAKFATVGLSEGLRAELARDGIQVTTIAPGLMRTGSFLNAYYKGDATKEYAIFSVINNLPLVSIDAERAARQVVRATKRGEADRVLSLSALSLAVVHGVAPGLTADLLGLVNRLLPSSAYPTPLYRGMDLEPQVDSALHRAGTAWGEAAALRFNQYPGPVNAEGALDLADVTVAMNGRHAAEEAAHA